MGLILSIVAALAIFKWVVVPGVGWLARNWLKVAAVAAVACLFGYVVFCVEQAESQKRWERDQESQRLTAQVQAQYNAPAPVYQQVQCVTCLGSLRASYCCPK